MTSFKCQGMNGCWGSLRNISRDKVT